MRHNTTTVKSRSISRLIRRISTGCLRKSRRLWTSRCQVHSLAQLAPCSDLPHNHRHHRLRPQLLHRLPLLRAHKKIWVCRCEQSRFGQLLEPPLILISVSRCNTPRSPRPAQWYSAGTIYTSILRHVTRHDNCSRPNDDASSPHSTLKKLADILAPDSLRGGYV